MAKHKRKHKKVVCKFGKLKHKVGKRVCRKRKPARRSRRSRR